MNEGNRPRRFSWRLWATMALLLVVVGIALTLRVQSNAGLGAPAAGELLNLEGNVPPASDPVTLRVVVLDAAFGVSPPAFEVDPWKAYVASRAIGRYLAVADADVAVVFDTRMDRPEGEIASHLRVAVEAGLPWWATITTVHRSSPGWTQLFGVSSITPLSAGTLAMARGPITLLSESRILAGNSIAQARPEVAVSRSGYLRFEVAMGPTASLLVSVLDGRAAVGAEAGVLTIARGEIVGGITAADGRMGILVPERWNVSLVRDAVVVESTGARGLLVDLTLSR